MAAFVGPCPEGMEVCHNNGDPTDNRMENLRYGTHSSNEQDKLIHGTDHQKNKDKCPRGHDLVHPNLTANKSRNGWRECLSCNRAQSYAWLHPSWKDRRQELSDRYFEAIMRDAEHPAA
jgi:hypothetical protein